MFDVFQMGYSTQCDECGRRIGMADRYCRWCGVDLHAGGMSDDA